MDLLPREGLRGLLQPAPMQQTIDLPHDPIDQLPQDIPEEALEPFVAGEGLVLQAFSEEVKEEE